MRGNSNLLDSDLMEMPGSAVPNKRSKRLLEDISNRVESGIQAEKEAALKKNLMLSDDEMDEPLPKRTRTVRTSNRARKAPLRYTEELVPSDEEQVSNKEHVGESIMPNRKVNLKLKSEHASDSEDNYSFDQDVRPDKKKNQVQEFDKEGDVVIAPSSKLSEYEIMIQKNIAKRQEFLASLDILKAKDELQELAPQPVVKKPTYRGIARTKEPIQPIERRRSLRQMKMTPDGDELPLPSEKDITRALSALSEKSNPRPPPGPGPVMEYCSVTDKEEFQTFLREVQDVDMKGEKKSVWCGDGESVIMTFKNMKITESRVAKVVPSRIFSVQIHPTLDKTMVIVGGKYGELGLWDVERYDSSNGAHFFSPHSRPINCITVDPSNYQSIFTTSYDGSLRKTDLTSMIVQQVYSYVDEDTYNVYTSWHAHRDENTVLVGGSLGDVVQVDVRDNEKPVEYKMHNGKTVKVITVHPERNHYLATASRDGNVYLWDLRKCQKNKPVAECPHGRNISGLEFSPVTGTSLLSTCSDDNLRIISCDLRNLEVQKKIRHNNQTGRWLTPFKARYLPGREDLFVVGSMMQPRRIEVWWNNGQLAHEFIGEDLGSVGSVNAFHPTRSVLAACNSSGRVHVFM